MPYANRIEFYEYRNAIGGDVSPKLKGWVPTAELTGNTLAGWMAGLKDKVAHGDIVSIVVKNDEGIYRVASLEVLTDIGDRIHKGVWYLSRKLAVRPLKRALEPQSFNGKLYRT